MGNLLVKSDTMEYYSAIKINQTFVTAWMFSRALCWVKNSVLGNSFVVQWLGRGTFTATWVQSLVWELKSQKLHSTAKKKKSIIKKKTSLLKGNILYYLIFINSQNNKTIVMEIRSVVARN